MCLRNRSRRWNRGFSLLWGFGNRNQGEKNQKGLKDLFAFNVCPKRNLLAPRFFRTKWMAVSLPLVSLVKSSLNQKLIKRPWGSDVSFSLEELLFPKDACSHWNVILIGDGQASRRGSITENKNLCSRRYGNIPQTPGSSLFILLIVRTPLWEAYAGNPGLAREADGQERSALEMNLRTLWYLCDIVTAWNFE